MKYNSFLELEQAYETILINEMSFEDELRYRTDCFDTYEGIGFTDTFDSPYEDKSKFNGKPFKVVRRMSYTEDNIDLECLPKWIISIDGEEIEAYPEEALWQKLSKCSKKKMKTKKKIGAILNSRLF